MKSRQLPLDFRFRPALTAGDFVIGDANRDALAWVDRWPDWPSHSLAIHGPEGCGKTHLAALWRARSNALTVNQPPSEEETGVSALILDAPSTWPERALLHLLNREREAGHSVLILDRVAPARWNVGLPDLRSRLNAIPAVGLLAPDDELLMAVLAKHFADRNLTVGSEVLSYLVQRIERSYSAAQRIVNAIDSRAMAEKKRVTLALVRDVIADIQG